ncbi:MAG: hypothetical protein NT023_07840, partial [Armatimonadetes bacterium]|nr:hypothetical protein [Armatimonadota bacterium]
MSESNSNPTSDKLLYRLRPLYTLGQGIRATWDRLGLVLAVSLSWSTVLMLLLLVWQKLARLLPPLPGNLLGACLIALVMPALYTGIVYVAHEAVRFEEVSFADVGRAFKRFYSVATKLGAVQIAVLLALQLNLLFYVSWKTTGGLMATLLCLYVLLFWAMMLVYQYPLLIAQETGMLDEPELGKTAKRGAVAVIRRSFYLALGSPLYTVACLVGIALITTLMGATAVLFVSLWAGMIAFITTISTRELFIKYEIVSAPVELKVIP